MHQTIINNLKVVNNDAHSAVIYQHKCDVIALTQEITALVIDFCMKTLKSVTWLLSGNQIFKNYQSVNRLTGQVSQF